jgi:phospholipid/cholesterol/gamma-HCH transport system substrate-binding protein
LETLTGKATDIAWKMEALLNNMLRLTSEGNRLRVRRVLDSADKLATSWEEVARTNKGRIKRILGNVDRTTIVMERASGNISRLVLANSATLKETLVSAAGAARSLKTAVHNLRPQATLKSIKDAADSVKRRINDPSISKALASLDTAAGRLTTLVNQLDAAVRQRDRQLGTTMRNLDQASAYLKQFARQIKERPSLLLRGETRKERSVP